MLDGFLSESMMGRAQEAKLLRDQGPQPPRLGQGQAQHDRRPAVWRRRRHGAEVRTGLRRPSSRSQTPGCRRIYLTPDGTPLSPALALELSQQKHLVLLSGHYEGIDQRIREKIIDQEVSIGDYVLTNGTLAAAVVIDAIGAFHPRCARGRKVVDDGKLHQQVARLSSIHASRRLSRHVRAGSAPFRQPWRDREVAARATGGKNAESQTRFTQITPSHESHHPRNHRQPGETQNCAVQSRRRCPRAHQGPRG